MFAGIHAVKLPVIDRDVVHVTGTWNELHHLYDLTRTSVVFDQSRGVTLIAGRAWFLISGHLPDEAVVISDPVQPLGKTRDARRGEHVIDLPSLRIDAEQRIQS